MTINTTNFEGNTASTGGGGAIYAASQDSGSFLDLEEVFFLYNTGVGAVDDDVYTTMADFTCYTKTASSTAVTGSSGAACIASTSAPTSMPTTAPTTVGTRLLLCARLPTVAPLPCRVHACL